MTSRTITFTDAATGTSRIAPTTPSNAACWSTRITASRLSDHLGTDARIHGTADRLVTPSGGRATAQAISGARLMLISGMGHDLPRATWPPILNAIVDHAQRIETVEHVARAKS